MDAVGDSDNVIWSSGDGKSLIGIDSRKDAKKWRQQMYKTF